MLRPAASPWKSLIARPIPSASRCINISATHNSSTAPALEPQTNVEASTVPTASPDAQFEVIGTPFSLLSVSLSASQTLYTRRGTLVGLSGVPQNTLSTLSLLEPFRRAPVGIPFLYQKISATSPVTALISTKSPISSIVTVNLDGRNDWVVSQRQALLAWTGHTLKTRPQYDVRLGIGNWGNTYITGRGLMALAGSGQIYQIQVRDGERYVAHPSNVVAYTASNSPPLPFRFKSSNLRFQVPNLGVSSFIESREWFQNMSKTAAWRTLATSYHTLKTWLRRSIWGDRLFLTFEGPTTLLLQSRASRLRDILTLRDVNEIAESPPGAVQDAVTRRIEQEIKEVEAKGSKAPIASIDEAGVVKDNTAKEVKVEAEKTVPTPKDIKI